MLVKEFNRLAAIETGSYAHDANGNTVSKVEGSKRWTYTCDYENRLTQAWDRKTRVRYQYDALGRRVERNLGFGSERTKFTYDGDDVLLDDANGTQTKYLNGLGIDDKLGSKTGGTAHYYLADHLGSTNALTDSNGAITSQASYDGFGNQTGSLTTRYGFTGRERDDFTGLMHYRARHYDPKLGRFISEDPIGFAGGDVNLYGYVWNNPLHFVDPFGLNGWGTNFANWADARTEFARRWWLRDPQYWVWNGMVNTGADLAFGFSDMFRVGNGLGRAMFCDNLPDYRRFELVAEDVVRGGGLFLAMAGPVAGRVKGGRGNDRAPFLPDEYYYNRRYKHAPPEGAPYGRFDRFDPNGDLHQVTTYDRFGNRVRQYDVGPRSRHGEGYHEFTYGPLHPRQLPGGGVRSPQRPF